MTNEGTFIPEEVGNRSATTFPGFCNVHDREMFESVETGDVTLDQRSAFLLSFRAVSMELFDKKAQHASLDFDRKMDSGRPFEFQAWFQQQMHAEAIGLAKGLADVERLKTVYDSMFKAGAPSSFRFYGIVFDRILPVVSAGAFQPEWSFAGEPLQRLGLGDELFQCVAFNLTVLNGKSVMVLGWTPDSDQVATAFVGSFKQLPDNRKADAAIRLAFEHVQNTCLRISWWRSMDVQLRTEATTRMLSGTAYAGRLRGPQGLQPTRTQLVDGLIESFAETWPPAQ